MVAPAVKDFWVLGKNKAATLAAREVALGKAKALGKAGFLNFPALTNSYIFLATAETSGAGGLPAQALILQKADGLRLAVSESGEKVLFSLALRAKDAETVSQMHDVLLGLKALAALGGMGNEDLRSLSSSARVESSGDTVSVNLSFPIGRAIEKARESE